MPNSWPAELGPVICIVGARPNFMKMAPILRAFAAHQPAIPTLLVHTGQHYDRDMNDKLFEDLRLPHPDINLEVGSGSHAVQTAEVMRRFEPVVDAVKVSFTQGGHGKSGRVQEFGDSHSSERIAADLAGWLIENQGRR